MAEETGLRRIARGSAWLLLSSIVISVLSGWAITQTGLIYKASFGLVDRGMGNAIHRGLQIPMATIFLVHVLVNAKINLLKRNAAVVNTVLIMIGVLLLAGVIYMETR